MKNSVLKSIIFSVFFVCAIQVGFAQSTLKLQANPELAVSGTSSLHDWEMPSEEASGKMIAETASGKLKTIESIEVVMPAESIKSGKSGMDKKAYDALNTKKHKSIIFKLNKASKSGDNWILEGTFQIAGVTKNVKINAKETSNNGTYGLSGAHEFKLTDYDITPPKALMGTIKTGDEVKISFDVNFK